MDEADLGGAKSADRRGPARRTGRPPNKKAGQIDEAILTAARDLFLSAGYEATSMEAVAQLAGVSKRTLYARHSTKEALMKAVVEDRVERWSKDASAGNAKVPEPFPDRLKRHALILMDSLGNPEVRQFDRLILTTATRFPEIAQSFYQIGYSYELAFLTGEIVAGTQDDPAPPADPERVARQLLSMIQGWRRTEETVREVSREEAARFAADAVDVLLRGRESW
ncbi:MAG TPA: TetR/AcrR family transcriptional regulator [Sphingobium sp.]|nr:TetR/AcrR family transcriptional regulator [Sphingobium sp.]